MRKKSKSIALLLEKFKKGACSPEELAIIQAWLARPENEQDAAEIIRKDFQHFNLSDYSGKGELLKGRMWQSIEQQINELQASTTNDRKQKTVHFPTNPWKRFLRIAAVVVFPLLALSGGILYYIYFNGKLNRREQSIAGPVYESRTEAGQKKNIKLADGSLIRLNANSKVSFNEDFLSLPNREVFLEGEAYFDVVKNGKPFIVKTSRSEVRVLGTTFNVNDFDAKSKLKVAVSSGKVSVHFPNQDLILVQPGKMATYNREENQAMVEEIEDMETEFGWKDDILLFKNASFSEIIDRLSDWYGVEFTIEEAFHPLRKNFSARFENESLKTVMEGISHAGGFYYEIDQKRVLISNRRKSMK